MGREGCHKQQSPSPNQARTDKIFGEWATPSGTASRPPKGGGFCPLHITAVPQYHLPSNSLTGMLQLPCRARPFVFQQTWLSKTFGGHDRCHPRFPAYLHVSRL